MHTITSSRLRQELSKTLTRLQAHRFELLVTRDGYPVAKIVPVSLAERTAWAVDAGLDAPPDAPLHAPSDGAPE